MCGYYTMLRMRVTATFFGQACDWPRDKRSQSTCLQPTAAMYSDPCRRFQGRRSLLLLADVPPHLFPVCLLLVICSFAVVFVS
jgi:hypothetical protein